MLWRHSLSTEKEILQNKPFHVSSFIYIGENRLLPKLGRINSTYTGFECM